jgi:hypothetical protein
MPVRRWMMLVLVLVLRVHGPVLRLATRIVQAHGRWRHKHVRRRKRQPRVRVWEEWWRWQVRRVMMMVLLRRRQRRTNVLRAELHLLLAIKAPCLFVKAIVEPLGRVGARFGPRTLHVRLLALDENRRVGLRQTARRGGFGWRWVGRLWCRCRRSRHAPDIDARRGASTLRLLVLLLFLLFLLRWYRFRGFNRQALGRRRRAPLERDARARGCAQYE